MVDHPRRAVTGFLSGLAVALFGTIAVIQIQIEPIGTTPTLHGLFPVPAAEFRRSSSREATFSATGGGRRDPNTVLNDPPETFVLTPSFADPLVVWPAVEFYLQSIPLAGA